MHNLQPASNLLGLHARKLGCGLLAKAPFVGGALPLNAITSLLGAPVVAWVLMAKQVAQVVLAVVQQVPELNLLETQALHLPVVVAVDQVLMTLISLEHLQRQLAQQRLAQAVQELW